MTVDHTCHTIAAHPDGVLKIDGFDGVDVDACFCIVAYGSRYHEYGIADNSLLFCCQTNEVTDGDLVLVFEEGVPTLYQYRKGKNVTEGGDKRLLHDRKRIHSKVLGSFNFYH